MQWSQHPSVLEAHNQSIYRIDSYHIYLPTLYMYYYYIYHYIYHSRCATMCNQLKQNVWIRAQLMTWIVFGSRSPLPKSSSVFFFFFFGKKTGLCSLLFFPLQRKTDDLKRIYSRSRRSSISNPPNRFNSHPTHIIDCITFRNQRHQISQNIDINIW